MMNVFELKVGDKVYFLEYAIEAYANSFEQIIKFGPYIVEKIERFGPSSQMFTCTLSDGTDLIKTLQFSPSAHFYASKIDIIEEYIKACTNCINPVYEELNKAKKYLEETKE